MVFRFDVYFCLCDVYAEKNERNFFGSLTIMLLKLKK